MKRIAFVAVLVVGVTTVAAAQSTPATDAIFARARQMVVSGNGSAGRLLIDSVLSATTTTSPVYGEALYWRAALATNSADAERDYRRLVVEYPLSSHVDEALLQLAQLESAHGDRASATVHLNQFLSDNPKNPDRPKAMQLYVRLLLEQNDLVRGCSALRQELKDVPESAIETRNQLEYYLPRCQANDVGAGGATPPATAAEPTATPSSKTGKDSSSKTPTVAPKARFTLQIAAYKSKSEAEALVKKLKARKLDAHLAPSGTLYRVQVGAYTTRGAAVAAQKELKAKKIVAFVAETTDK